MAQPLARTTLTLPNLIGVSVSDSPCVLSRDQFARVGAAIFAARPQDPRAVCFLGGALNALASARGAQNIFSLQGDLGDDPFLVVAGPNGCAALMAVESSRGFHARLFTDPDTVDRAALVLAQFGDFNYSLDAVTDPESQRAFVSGIAMALFGDQALRGADFGGLMPGEQRWVDLGRSLAELIDRAGVFNLSNVQRLLQEIGAARALVGQLDSAQGQLVVVAAAPAAAPRALGAQHPLIAGALRSQRTTSAVAADTAGMGGEEGRWVGGMALTVVPLMTEGRAWGALLVSSERPLSLAARAALNGLGALLVGAMQVTPAPVPALPASGSFTAPAGLARPAAMPPIPPSRPPVNGQPAPAPAAPPSGPAPQRAGGLAQRAMTLARPAATSDVAALMGHLRDALVIADTQGRLVSFTPAAMTLLGLTPEARGKSLVESGAWCLAPLLTDALIGETIPHQIEAPGGQTLTASAVELDQGRWAFVLHPVGGPAAPAESYYPAGGASTMVVSESERNENFLANFSNIIRVPLRELRSLITQVPVAGNLNEQQSRLIGQVVRLNSELTMLVNDLLALGQIRLQSGESRTPLRLDLLVEAAVGTQYAEFGRRGQHVDTEIEPGLPRVPGSEEGLGRAVSAIIDNAIKYSPAGAHIRVGVRRQGQEIVVSVQDSGPGLAEDELAQVFDPFYRAPSTESLGVSGRGLGLTITKAVIEQHGGRTWAEGAPGQGCLFAFSIPID